MTPDLVPDSDVLRLRRSGPLGVPMGLGTYRIYWGIILGRNLTDAETKEIFSKINGLGPVRWEHTWEYIESLPKSDVSFWRSQI